jgi:hypothetical protein
VVRISAVLLLLWCIPASSQETLTTERAKTLVQTYVQKTGLVATQATGEFAPYLERVTDTDYSSKALLSNMTDARFSVFLATGYVTRSDESVSLPHLSGTWESSYDHEQQANEYEHKHFKITLTQNPADVRKLSGDTDIWGKNSTGGGGETFGAVNDKGEVWLRFGAYRENFVIAESQGLVTLQRHAQTDFNLVRRSTPNPARVVLHRYVYHISPKLRALSTEGTARIGTVRVDSVRELLLDNYTQAHGDVNYTILYNELGRILMGTGERGKSGSCRFQQTTERKWTVVSCEMPMTFR